jgi:hypothetical protein
MNSKEDQEVYNVKYAAKPFCKMSDAEISICADNLMVNIYAITGWNLPTDEVVEGELSRQFAYTLKEAYGNYNNLEIEFAFRKYAPGVKDWGKNFNLLLFSEVMEPYIEHRIEVSKIEELKSVTKMILNNQITTEAEKLEDIADWEKRSNVNIQMIPPYIYDYLLEFGKINPANKEKFEAIKRAAELKKQLLYEESLSLRPDDVNAYRKFMEGYTNGFKTDESSLLKILAKKIIVFDYLTLNSKK